MAKLVDVGSIGAYFESLSDPRHLRNRKHLLVDIAVIAVCGILCGCDGPTAIHR
jgi:DDE_Tnp_1-associated